VPEIITARLRLRMFRPKDVDAYFTAIHSDPDVMRYMPGGIPRPRERSEALIMRAMLWWSDHRYGLWAVETIEGRALIGHCGLARQRDDEVTGTSSGLAQEPDTGAVELAYALARSSWGQGLASEAARASLRYGFERAGLDRIIALAEPDNTASRRVMEKVGMRFEGISTRYYGGASLALYSVSRADFPPWPAGAPYTLIEDGRRSRAVRPA
jgi:RimJ/RimL family protein N-acetyltransferase